MIRPKNRLSASIHGRLKGDAMVSAPHGAHNSEFIFGSIRDLHVYRKSSDNVAAAQPVSHLHHWYRGVWMKYKPLRRKKLVLHIHPDRPKARIRGKKQRGILGHRIRPARVTRSAHERDNEGVVRDSRSPKINIRNCYAAVRRISRKIDGIVIVVKAQLRGILARLPRVADAVIVTARTQYFNHQPGHADHLPCTTGIDRGEDARPCGQSKVRCTCGRERSLEHHHVSVIRNPGSRIQIREVSS